MTEREFLFKLLADKCTFTERINICLCSWTWVLPQLKTEDLHERLGKTWVLHLQAVHQVLLCCHQSRLGCGSPTFKFVLQALV